MPKKSPPKKPPSPVAKKWDAKHGAWVSVYTEGTSTTGKASRPDYTLINLVE